MGRTASPCLTVRQDSRINMGALPGSDLPGVPHLRFRAFLVGKVTFAGHGCRTGGSWKDPSAEGIPMFFYVFHHSNIFKLYLVFLIIQNMVLPRYIFS